MTVRYSNFQAIGTKWAFQVRDVIANDAWESLLQRIYLRIETFDKAYSRFRADSLVTIISQKAGTHKLPPDGHTMLKLYERLYRASGGKVTPLIGQTIADAGYDAEYSLDSKTVQRPPLWEDVLVYDEDSITVKQPVLLDFGAAGKGYLVDIVAELVEKAGIGNFTIDAGGDILHRSARHDELEVGMENPLDTSEAVGIVKISNQSLCASAGSKRSWGTFHHIIDPVELESPVDVIATWVLADDTMTADGLATALFFTSPSILHKQFSFSYALLTKNMSLGYSKDFPVTVFTAG